LGRVLSRRSRSATPIPPYEPPKEVFTPPREVTITPPFVQSKSRRSRSKSRGARSRTPEVRKGELGLGVKKELPDIDWTLPMPPPSPGDDPLLLSGRPRRPRLGLRGEPHDDEDEEEETMELDVHALGGMEGLMDVSMDEIDLDVPPSTDFSDGEDAMPIFDLAGGQDDDVGAWSDSDDDSDGGKGVGEAEEGEGEYTGRFTMLTVRTKADPPTSATRERMEGWGRPVRWVFLFLSHFLVECGLLAIGNVFADYYFLGVVVRTRARKLRRGLGCLVLGSWVVVREGRRMRRWGSCLLLGMMIMRKMKRRRRLSMSRGRRTMMWKKKPMKKKLKRKNIPSSKLRVTLMVPRT